MSRIWSLNICGHWTIGKMLLWRNWENSERGKRIARAIRKDHLKEEIDQQRCLDWNEARSMGNVTDQWLSNFNGSPRSSKDKAMPLWAAYLPLKPNPYSSQSLLMHHIGGWSLRSQSYSLSSMNKHGGTTRTKTERKCGVLIINDL